MRSIRLQAPTITRKIEHWFTCGADGRTNGHETTKIFSDGENPNPNQIFLSKGHC